MSVNTSSLSEMSAQITSYSTSRYQPLPNYSINNGQKQYRIVIARILKPAQPYPDGLANRPVLSVLNKDLETSKCIENIIKNLPEVEAEFDLPEYVELDAYKAKKIEMNIVNKYMKNPNCGENSCLADPLELPTIHPKTENWQKNVGHDHTYSLYENPACMYVDLRYFCNICHRNNLNMFTYNTHMMRHIVKNNVICTICGQKFLTTTCLNNHIATHKTICDVCGTEVPSVQIFAHQKANKQRKRVLNAKNRFNVSKKEKINFCVICMGSFSMSDYPEHVASHVLTQKKERNNDEEVCDFRKFLPY